MADIKITDLVDEKVFEELANLSQGIKEVKQQYIEAAQELAKGLNVKVSTAGDLQKLNEAVAESSRKAQQATDQLNTTIDKQREIIGQTTNVISRELAEIEKENKAKRDAFAQDKDALDIAKSIIGTRDQNILRLSKLQTELKNVKESQKALDDAVKAGTISENAAVAKRAEYLEQQRTLKAAIHDLNGILNNQDKQMQAANGSYQQLSLQLEMMKKAYKSLNEEEKNSDIGKKLGDEIQNMDAHLKDLAADMGEFQRNTGNYAIANQSVKTELRELIQELALLTIQYRSMSDEERNSAEGKSMEEKIQSMTQKAAQLKDTVDDVNRAIKSGASDTSTFSAISEGINLLISGFGGLKSAAHLLGVGEKDLIKVQTTLQATLAASNALTKAQTALQKESALMQGVSKVQTMAHTAAIKMKTLAESESIIVSKAATIAQAAFNAVANMNPYVLLATGIGLAVTAFVGFISSTEEETEEMKKQREEAERLKREYEEFIDVELQLNQARVDAIDSCSDEISQLYILYNAATDVTRSYEERKKAVDTLQKIYPDYFKNLSDEAIMAGNAADQYERLTEAIISKAIAESKQELIQKYAEEYVKSLQKMQQAEKVYNEAKRVWDIEEGQRKAKEERTHEGREYNDNGIEVAQSDNTRIAKVEEMRARAYSDAKQAFDMAEANLNTLKKEAADYKKSMEEVAGLLTGEEMDILMGKIVGNHGNSTSSDNDKEVKTKSEDEIKKELLEMAQEIITSRLSLVEEGSRQEYDLTQQYIDAETQLRHMKLDKQYADEKKSLEEALANKTITQEQYDANLLSLEDAYSKQSVLIDQRMNNEKEKARKKYSEALVKQIQEEYQHEQEQRELDLMQQMTVLAKQRTQKLITEEEYQKQLADMQRKFAEETANKQIEMLEKVLESEALTAELREKINNELKAAKIKAAKEVADEELKNLKKTEKEDEKSAAKRRRTTNKYLQTVSKMIGQVNQLVSTIYDGQLAKIDEEKEAAEKAYEEEVAQIENLQETGAISKEEAEARKRAAEQRTAEKEEEIEKKKKEIKYKQAMWEKATSIAQAGIATAVAITEALPNVVLAALVGALGAMEVATILATPISTYAKGTGKDGHKGGLALVGDGGKQEAVVYGGKMWITPDTPTLVDMPKGAMVYPDANKIPEPVLQNVSMTKDSKPVVIVNTDTRKLEKGMDKNNRLLQHAIIATQRAQYNANYQAYKARL